MFVAMFAFTALIVFLHLINAAFIDGSLFNLSGDLTVPDFASALVFAIAAVVCLRVADRRLGDRSTWRWIGAIMLVLAIESLADIHGRIEDVDALTNVAYVLEPLLGVALLVILAPRARRLARPAPQLLAAAVLVYVIAEVAGGLISVTDLEGALRGVAIIIEEWGEMIVACLVAAAAASAPAGLGAPAPDAERHGVHARP